MTSERVIKEAPVPVRWHWIEWPGYVAQCKLNHEVDHIDPCVFGFLEYGDVVSVELSNGQTVIVRAKK